MIPLPNIDVAKVMKYGGIGVVVATFIFLIYSRNDFKEKFQQEQISHQVTVESYKTAQREAELKNLAQVKEIESKRKEQTDAIQIKYNQRLADVRTKYDSLRNKYETLASSSSNLSTGGLPNSSPGANGSTGEDGLPSSSPVIETKTTLEDLFLCSLQSSRLQGLQEWVKAQQSVKTFD